MDMIAWMAWTPETAVFFGVIALLLVGMCVWEWISPGGGPRHGILGLDTTRGDRLFISLLGAAFIHLIWMFFFGTPLWGANAIAIVYAIAVFVWV